MLTNSIGAPTPKSVPSEIAKPLVSAANLIIPEWVHCEICKRREYNGSNSTRLLLGYCHPCGHIICRDCAMHNANSHNCKYFQLKIKLLLFFMKIFFFFLFFMCSMFKINTRLSD